MWITLRYGDPNSSLVLFYGKNNTQSHHVALRYLYSIAQMWATQMSHIGGCLRSKHLSKIFLQQKPRMLRRQAEIIL